MRKTDKPDRCKATPATFEVNCRQSLVIGAGAGKEYAFGRNLRYVANTPPQQRMV